MTIENETTAEIEAKQAEIKERILHLLTIYPVISPTMLQSGLGAQVKPEIWHPALEALITAGEVIREVEDATTPTGRYNAYIKLSLPGTVVSVAG